MSLSLNYPTVRPTLLLDFINTDQIDPRITFSRASSATYFNSNGILTTAATNALRRDYNPSTLAPQGFLVEEQRTNSIRNNTMQGAVAGTPGTLPTNWSTFTSLTGLTREVVGTGTENGITYIDIRLSGTPSAAGDYGIYEETSTGIAAATGQTWAQSVFLRTTAGSQAGISSITLRVDENTSGGVFVSNKTSSALTVTSTLTRFSAAYTLTGGATVACVMPWVRLVLSGVAIDITLRIGLPQLEQGAFATSVIPTTTTALTRSADAAFTPVGAWYNATVSTLYTEFNTPVPTTVTNSAVVAGYDDGTANNRFGNFYVSNTGAVSANQVTAGAANYTITGASGLTLSSVQKQATRFQAGSYASSVNGAAAVTDSFASAPPTVNTLRFGLRPSGTQANMWLRRVMVYPSGLSNAQLQAITSA